MKNITKNFEDLYHPVSLLVFYQCKASKKTTDTYVEHFDMDSNGCPINAHPLTVTEAQQLVKALKVSESQAILKSESIIGNHILHLDTDKSKVIWYTRAIKKELCFTENLGIPKGFASIPPLIWMAGRNNLYLYALKNTKRPTITTQLFHAPFFNVYENGNVCMGTVDISIKKTASLEEFTNAWENYFFNSYFSHLLQGHNPIKGNCVTLWDELITTGNLFPKNVLKRSNVTMKNLLK